MQANVHFAKAPVRLLTTSIIAMSALLVGCGPDPSQHLDTSTTRRFTGVCPDCPNIDGMVTIYESQGLFDLDIDEFPGFDSTGVNTVYIEFKRDPSTAARSLPFVPSDIENGIAETSLALPGSLDYTVDSGLGAELVFEDTARTVEVRVEVGIQDGE